MINAGEAAIQQQKQQIQVRDQELSQAQAMLQQNAKEIEQLQRSNSAWYNSKWLWIAIGAGATAFFIKK